MKSISIEVMLLRWSETSNGGATIVLQLVDSSELAPFKAMSLAKGKQAGQLLQAVLVPIEPEMQKAIEPDKEPATVLTPRQQSVHNAIADQRPDWVDKQPAKKPAKFPDGLTGLAVRWCEDHDFTTWITDTYPDYAQSVVDRMKSTDGPDVQAKLIICDLCDINSRKELNTNPPAAAIFKRKILDVYKEHRLEHGLDDKPF